ncbi:unnamed protein product [Phytomonas sp. Hart1]|nr:unnamed protein product [Phytomonas sp. Hart1]|eukprot:CCW71467.1 unnamed protein product [Phytomonas sp. isolate Hart1]
MRHISCVSTHLLLWITPCYKTSKPVRKAFMRTLGVELMTCREVLPIFFVNCRRHYTPPQPPQSSKGFTCRVDDLLAGMHHTTSPGKHHPSRQKKSGADAEKARSSFALTSPARVPVEDLFKGEKDGAEALHEDSDILNCTDDSSKGRRPHHLESGMWDVESAEHEAAFYGAALDSVASRDAGGRAASVDPNSASVLSQYDVREVYKGLKSTPISPDYSFVDGEIEFSGGEAVLDGLDGEPDVPAPITEVLESEAPMSADNRGDLFTELSTLPFVNLAFSDDDTDSYEDENIFEPDDTDSEGNLDVLADSEEELAQYFFQEQDPTQHTPLTSNEESSASTEGIDRTCDRNATVSDDEFRPLKGNLTNLHEVASSFSLNPPEQNSEDGLPLSEAFDDVAAQLAELRSMGESLPSTIR